MLELKDDYLAAEAEIKQLLEQIPELRKVYSSTDMAQMEERSQLTPAAHLIYRGDRIPQRVQGGLLAQVTQVWWVVLAVKLTSREPAGELLASLVKKLSGVHTTLGPLQRVNAPQPSFSKGFGYYPIAIEISFKTKGARA